MQICGFTLNKTYLLYITYTMLCVTSSVLRCQYWTLYINICIEMKRAYYPY